MANPKGLKTWRREGLSYRRSEQERQGMAQEYRMWLCKSRGWFTETETCKRCHGEGLALPNHDGMTYSRLRTWKRKRVEAGKPPYLTEDDKETCGNCDGQGEVRLSGSVPDFKRVDAYLSEQSRRLDELAMNAVEGIEERLRARGFRPVLYRHNPQSLAAYDAIMAEHAAVCAEVDRLNEQAQQAHEQVEADYEAMTSEEKVEALNSGDLFTEARALEREAQIARQKLWSFHVHRGFWYQPGDRRILFTGTHAAGRYHEAPKSTVKIVMSPGRAPQAAELDILVAEAIDELIGEAELIAA